VSKWPITGDDKGSGRVATGARLGYPTNTPPSGKLLSGWRFTTGGQGQIPVTVYEIFYDVYLKSVSGGTFTYVYRYWYRQVKWEVPRQGTDRSPSWVPAPNSAVKVISVTDVSVRKSIRVDGRDIALPDLPLTGNGRVGPGLPAATPEQFGWKGAGQGVQAGTINRGVGREFFPTANPFGYTGSSPAPGNSSGGGGETGGGDEAGGNDDPYRSEGPPIEGFGDPRKTFFNPPPVITATGAYVPVVYDWEGNRVTGVDATAPGTRQSLLGVGSYAQRVQRKARIVQWIKIEDEWRVTQSGEAYDRKGKVKDSWDNSQPLVPNNVRYGFRFTYNPSEVSFSMSPIPGIDPGVIISGIGRSYPMGDEDGGSIQITTYLNRIEDMAFLVRRGSGKWGYSTNVRPYGNRDIDVKDLEGIATRGTGYDLEFLFRATLGKPYRTKTRGLTADIGLILGLPLLLNMGGGMSYTGRLTGLSYNHMYFTSQMVPTFTQVTMSFSRFPDATSFNENPNPGGSGNDDKPKKKKKNKR